jgi:hypothetical protein
MLKNLYNIYFAYIYILFININFNYCNNNNDVDTNFDTSILTNINTPLLVIGGLCICGICGYFLYRWYTNPSNPQTSIIDNEININDSNNIEQTSIIDINQENVVEEMNLYLDFNFPTFFLNLENAGIRAGSLSEIFTLSDLNSSNIVNSYINGIYKLLYIIDNNYIFTNFRFFSSDNLLELQLLLKNIFKIHNSVKELALNNVYSEEEKKAISNIFNNIELETVEVLEKICIFLNSGF